MFIKKDAEKSSNGHNKVSKSNGTVSTIAQGTTLNGDIESDSNMRIDGNIIGNVYCKARVVLGESGIVQGNVTAENLDVLGTVNGDVVTNDLTCLKAKSTVNGDISTKRLQIEPNATFNGQCKMTTGQAATKNTSSKNGVEKKAEQLAVSEN